MTTNENNDISILELILSFITEGDLNNLYFYRFEKRIATIFKLKSNTLHDIESGGDIKESEVDANTWKD